jgi:hypothetical protein
MLRCGIKLVDRHRAVANLNQRSHVVAGGAERLRLDACWGACGSGAWSRHAGASARTARRCVAAVRGLNRRERVGRTLRFALNELAADAVRTPRDRSGGVEAGGGAAGRA